MPLCYLLIRAFDANSEELARIVFRQRNAMLLLNTLSLVVGVLVMSTAIALPLALLTTRTSMAGRRSLALAGILPLAIPGYLMAYALLGLGGNYGAVAQLTGWVFPRPSGYLGAVLILCLCNFPYLYFNLRAALLTMDPCLEEVALSLGQSRRQVLMRVFLPQLKPAFSAGTLLISLHVLSDFAAVSLMRFETLSSALYLQYNSAFDRTYAAWLALMLLGVTGLALGAEAWFLKGLRLDRAGAANARPPKVVRLRGWAPAAYGFVLLVTCASVVVPVCSMIFWALKSPSTAVISDLGVSLLGSIMASLPAALIATALVVPILFMSVRMPSRATRLLEKATYIGYSTPSLAFALGLVFFTLRVVPSLYQTLFLLIYAFTMRYIAEAVGPVRTALLQAGPRTEEAARSLGYTWFQSMIRVTLPLIRNGLFISMAFIFLSCMKELHLTLFLSPLGYHTLAVDVWGYVEEAMFAEAAPFALTILVFSGLFVGVLLTQEKRPA